MRKLFHFFGSIQFAVTLIAVTAIYVIAGTMIESLSDSHLYAASWTYQHPAFMALLGFFFINILFSALRRWPFQLRHIPFLITHLGLLMILSGVMIKTLYGVQGVMVLLEGSGSNSLLIPYTQAIRLENRLGDVNIYGIKDTNAPFELKGYTPHGSELFESWMNGTRAFINGLPPFPVSDWEPGSPIPISARAQMLPKPEEPWDLVALRVNDALPAIEQLYIQGLKSHSIQPSDLKLNFQPSGSFEKPAVTITGTQIPLSGNESLMNDEKIDLVHTPTLAFIRDHSKDTYLVYFDQYGRVHSQRYSTTRPNSLVAYNEGFDGYSIAANIVHHPQSRKDKEDQILSMLKREVESASPEQLIPPLQLLYESSGSAYSTLLVELLSNWNDPETVNLPRIHWETIDPKHYHGLKWATHFFKTGGTSDSWPLPLPTSSKEEQNAFMIQQILSISEQLPETGLYPDCELMKTYLMAYGVHFAGICPPLDQVDFASHAIQIESPLFLKYQAAPPLKQLEENRPITTIQMKNGLNMTLRYDPTGSGFCFPSPDRQWLVRFQPEVQELPYHLRLRNARAITYANSTQPFSYEADLIVQKGNEDVETTLSMNHVYETWDGYRFYLSNISPSETEVKRVQLAVNRDPAKYFLTYPGGLLVTLGIFLLFWWKRKG